MERTINDLYLIQSGIWIGYKGYPWLVAKIAIIAVASLPT